jgi:hypothetical protein
MNTVTEKKPSGLDVLLAKAKPKKKSGSKAPQVNRPDLQEKCNQFLKVRGQLKTLEAVKSGLAADLIAASEEARIAESRKAGKSLSSVRLNNLKYVSQQSFSDITCHKDCGDDGHHPDCEIVRVQAVKGLADYLETCVLVKVPNVSQLTEEQGLALAQLQESGAVEISTILKVKKCYLSDRTMKDAVAAIQEEAMLKNRAFMQADE